MRGDKRQDVSVCNLMHFGDSRRIEISKKLAQIQTIILYRSLASTQVGQVGNQLFHLLSYLSVKCMMNRSETTLADESERKHVIQGLYTPDLFSFLVTYSASKMACSC